MEQDYNRLVKGQIDVFVLRRSAHFQVVRELFRRFSNLSIQRDEHLTLLRIEKSHPFPSCSLTFNEDHKS